MSRRRIIYSFLIAPLDPAYKAGVADALPVTGIETLLLQPPQLLHRFLENTVEVFVFRDTVFYDPLNIVDI
jgi:hypothetical protein